jgi:adenylate kinase
LFIEGHFSHCAECDRIIVLRCAPETLAGRLRERGYSESKVTENVQAEILDVILCEAIGAGVPVCEIDSSVDSTDRIADKVEDFIKGNTNKYRPGNIDWMGELGKWF